MTTINVTVATVKATLPAGTTSGTARVSIFTTGNAPYASQYIADLSTPVVFLNVPAGDYYATAVRLDLAGAVELGTVVQSANFNIPADTYDAPSTVDITLV